MTPPAVKATNAVMSVNLPGGTLNLRDATAEDADAIAALHAESWRSAYRGIVSDEFLEHSVVEDRLKVWRNRLSPPHLHEYRTRVSIYGEELAGFASMSNKPDPEWGLLLDNLHVRPELKGRGIGRALIADAAAWAALRLPRAPLHLWVYAQNQASRDFYERLGGVPEARTTGRAPDGGQAESVRYVWRDLNTLAGG